VPLAEPIDPADALRANIAMVAELSRPERMLDDRLRIVRDVDVTSALIAGLTRSPRSCT
jgi:hypothetical protein